MHKLIQSIRFLTCTARDTIYSRNVWVAEGCCFMAAALAFLVLGYGIGRTSAPTMPPGKYLFRFEDMLPNVDGTLLGRMMPNEHKSIMDIGIEVQADGVWVLTPPKIMRMGEYPFRDMPPEGAVPLK